MIAQTSPPSSKRIAASGENVRGSYPPTFYEKKILQILPGPFDVVWYDKDAKALYVQQILFAASIRVYEITENQWGAKSRQHSLDAVVPVDVNDLFGNLDCSESDGYVGMVPHGADPLDGRYGLCVHHLDISNGVAIA